MGTRSGGVNGAPESGAPLFTFDGAQRIRSWNRACEELTGIPAESVVGKHCWAVLCGTDERGAPICHPTCPHHRMLRARWPVAPTPMVIPTSEGVSRVQVAMVTLQGSTLFAAVLLDPQRVTSPGAASPSAGEASLTPRQRTVLTLLAHGRPAKAIASDLHLSEMTVRNHIRGILRALGCTSQLAAVAEARRRGIVDAGHGA